MDSKLNENINQKPDVDVAQQRPLFWLLAAILLVSCGAPKAVFEGQLRATLSDVEASNLQAIEELRWRLIDRTKAYEEMDVKRVRRIRQLEDTVRRAMTKCGTDAKHWGVLEVLNEEVKL